MFKLFQSESKTIIAAAAIIGLFSFVSRLVGFIRDRILAGEFGAGNTLDIYYAAFKIPDLLFSLIVIGGISASFIPLFTQYYSGNHRPQAWKFANSMLNIILFSMICVSVLMALFAVPIASWVAPGFSAEKQEAVGSFMRVMLLAQMVLAISSVFGSMLQSVKRFFLFALAPLFYNVGIMIGALWFVDLFGPIGLAWGVVLGSVFHAVIQFVGCRDIGYAYRPVFDVGSKEVRDALKMTGPRVLGIAINQIFFVILAIFATSLLAGSVTILQFAYNIQFFPVGIIGISLAIGAFPTFAEYLHQNDFQRFRDAFSLTIRQAIFFLIPLSILFLILRAQIVRVVVGAGAFDWPSTILTANTLAFFALTFIPQACIFILSRAFFAAQDSLTPLTAGLIGSFVGLISAFLFRESFGVVGLGMAFSLYAIVNFVLLWVPLRQRVGSLDEAVILQSLLKLTVAGLVCALIAQMSKPILSNLFSLDSFFGVFMQGGVAGLLGMIGYLATAWLLKSPELRLFMTSVHRKILRKSQPHESIPSDS